MEDDATITFFKSVKSAVIHAATGLDCKSLNRGLFARAPRGGWKIKCHCVFAALTQRRHAGPLEAATF